MQKTFCRKTAEKQQTEHNYDRSLSGQINGLGLFSHLHKNEKRPSLNPITLAKTVR